MYPFSPSRPQHDFLSSTADFVVYGGAAGSGKSAALIIDPLRHSQGPYANAGSRAVLFRRTYPQIAAPGALLDETRKFYGPLSASFNHTRSEWTFPCGATVGLRALQFTRDLNNFQGAAFTWLGIDEATLFEEEQIFFLHGRCRSTTGIKPSTRLTCNPDSASWLCGFLSFWIDQATGYPIKERSGHIRHFTRINGKFDWYDEPQFDQQTGEKISTSATFIPATLEDNIALTTADPGYRQKLLALKESERERFLLGCWLAGSGDATEWPRELFIGVTVQIEDFPVPINRSCVRMFSLDASKGRHAHKGDYSSICCLCQTSDLAYIDADLARRSPSQIVEDLFLFCEQEHHRIKSGDMIGCETLQFQELFRDAIYRYAKDHPEYALSKFLAMGNPVIQVEDTTPKAMRIRRMSAKIKNREFRFLENPGTMLLLNQLRQFDGLQKKGVHDDGPDSMEMCTQLPRHLELMYERMRK
jgi:hypothetical protein